MRQFDGSVLRDARIRQGLSQEDLGRKIGIGKTSVCEWEAGKRFPATRFLPALADSLRIGIDQLFTEKEVLPHDEVQHGKEVKQDAES